MDEKGQNWARCIRELLDRHNLTIRGAAIKAGRPSLRTYLADWLAGHIPQYNTAVNFLEHFPKEEAVKCLLAAGYPTPTEWQEGIAEGAAMYEPEVVAHLRKAYPKLSPDDIRAIHDIIAEAEAELEDERKDK